MTDISNLQHHARIADGFLKRHGAIPPTCLIQTAHGLILVALPFDGEREKTESLMCLRYLIQRKQAVSYTMIMETWFVVRPDKSASGAPPSQCSDRQEAVVCQHTTRSSMVDLKIFPIVRDSLGKPSLDFDSDDNPFDGVATGRFANLFDSAPLDKLTFTQRRKLGKMAVKLYDSRIVQH